jgi:hypothetical protein
MVIGRHKADVPAPRSGVVVPLPVDDEPDLQTVYDRYRAVSSRVAPDLVSTPEVAHARAALIRALLEDGWQAPDSVHDRLRADERILGPRLVAAS